MSEFENFLFSKLVSRIQNLEKKESHHRRVEHMKHKI